MIPQKPPKSTFPVEMFYQKFFYILVSVDSKISPNFIEIGGLLFFGPFGIAVPTAGSNSYEEDYDYDSNDSGMQWDCPGWKPLKKSGSRRPQTRFEGKFSVTLMRVGQVRVSIHLKP